MSSTQKMEKLMQKVADGKSTDDEWASLCARLQELSENYDNITQPSIWFSLKFLKKLRSVGLDVLHHVPFLLDIVYDIEARRCNTIADCQDRLAADHVRPTETKVIPQPQRKILERLVQDHERLRGVFVKIMRDLCLCHLEHILLNPKGFEPEVFSVALLDYFPWMDESFESPRLHTKDDVFTQSEFASFAQGGIDAVQKLQTLVTWMQNMVATNVNVNMDDALLLPKPANLFKCRSATRAADVLDGYAIVVWDAIKDYENVTRALEKIQA
ncbi:hypothetical protein CYLTODRAFT_426291 [Cylindrobasidium torrendii FP15055 ss-10]|uniref:Uncharacterized protein n=1 Tax=Cylindrobasidium torrendii FP15055 ss-10 TaxID=1314674 RepID=A0A0D7AXZ1_9AGAR|nr:hypothetical protein CYLTODRAFT_426291 [Cylindrobasidium torrendii FP15055 ss-10]